MISHLGPAARSRRADVPAREDMLVARLHSMAPHLDGEPDPDFRAATRARLVAMAAVRSPEPEPASPLRRLLTAGPDLAPQRWRTRVTAGLAGAALTVTALAGVVALATDAGPGDVLYGVKRGTEQTRLALASDTERGRTLLEFASTRLAELDALLADGASALPAAGSAAGPDGGDVVLAADVDPALVVETLATMDRQTSEGAAWLTQQSVESDGAAPLDDLSTWLDGQTEGLEALRPEVPAGADDAVTESLGLLTQVAQRADGLRTALECPAGPAVAGADEFGPVPLPACPEAPTSGTEGGGDEPSTSSASSGGVADPSTGSADPTGAAPGGGTDGSTGGSTGGAVPGSTGGGGPLDPPDTGVSTPRLPTDVVPTLPSPPLPSLPLPGRQPSPTSSSPGISVGVCLPPLPPIGDC